MGGRRSSFLLLVFSLSPMKKAVLPRERMRRRQCPQLSIAGHSSFSRESSKSVYLCRPSVLPFAVGVWSLGKGRCQSGGLAVGRVERSECSWLRKKVASLSLCTIVYKNLGTSHGQTDSPRSHCSPDIITPHFIGTLITSHTIGMWTKRPAHHSLS